MPGMRKPGRRRSRFSERIGVMVLVFDLWRRLPPKRRRQVLSLARKHGPRVAKKAVTSRRPGRRR
jgi:hypothetical protein